MSVLMLYSKAGCHLCDEMRVVAERAAAAAGVTLEVVDIVRDAALLARYRHEIPVLLLDGQEIARHRTTDAAITTALVQRQG